MKTEIEKKQKNKTSLTTDKTTQRQSNKKSVIPFADNRPEVITQRKLQETANNHHNTHQLDSIQRMANESLQQKNSIESKQDNASEPIQLKKLKTSGGVWEDKEYRAAQNGDPGVNDMSIMNGVRIKMDFTPEHPAESEVIGISQVVKSEQKAPSHPAANPFPSSRIGDKGYQVDQVDPKTNPLYAGAGQHPKAEDIHKNGTHDFLGQHGKRVKTDDGWDVKEAKLEDTPVLWKYVYGQPSNGFYEKESQLFETTALAVKGKQKGLHYGSVSWGWSADNTGALRIEPFKIASYGLPTANFLTSKEKWNADPTKQDLPQASNEATVKKLWNECHVLENVDKTNPERTIDFYREVASLKDDKDAISLLRRSHISRFWVSLNQDLKTKVISALNKSGEAMLTDIRKLF